MVSSQANGLVRIPAQGNALGFGAVFFQLQASGLPHNTGVVSSHRSPRCASPMPQSLSQVILHIVFSTQ
ncbi:MAG: hypothetical protein ACLQM8_11695, partial [Limisphaerales bacterium]